MSRIIAASFGLLLAFSAVSTALEPPGEGGRMGSKSFSSPDAADEALKSGNHLVSPELVADFKNRLSKAKGKPISVPGRRVGLPSQGNPKILVLLIEFEDYPHKAVDTAEAMHDKIFNAGDVFPYESLTGYYKRSSYGKLNIGGNVLGWYKAGRRADVPQDVAGQRVLIEQAVSSYTEHDFSQYDNNGDGTIDYLAVIWTGPPGAWNSFWWGKKMNFSDPKFLVGGEKLGVFSWQWETSDWGSEQASFSPRIMIHETGHALGLPDYYDYKPGEGVEGGLGRFDMMESNNNDHNCFSKFLLGWIEPVVAAPGKFTLRPASESPRCVLLAPPGWDKNPFSEFFLVENRQKTGNDGDQNFPGGGLVIWHVDARLTEDAKGLLYNNSTTDRKLLKIMEADGLEDIVMGKSYGVEDFYNAGSEFGPLTIPSGRLYDGTDTGFRLTALGGSTDASFILTRTITSVAPLYPVMPIRPVRPAKPGER